MSPFYTCLSILIVSILILIGAQSHSDTTLPSGAVMDSEICGDHNCSGHVSATDALMVLQRAVDLPITLRCDCSGGTASTSTTTTTHNITTTTFTGETTSSSTTTTLLP